MNEELDFEILVVMADLVNKKDNRGADLLHRVWKDRAMLIDAVRAIRDWDMMSSEARSFARIDFIANTVLKDVGDTE